MAPYNVEYDKYIMKTYNKFSIEADKGEGVYLYDTSGKKYLDMCAGIAVNALGYTHKGLQDALNEQIDQMLHVSNLFYIPNQLEAAKLLIDHSIFSKVFFCNSGAEANEAALKLARKYGSSKNKEKTKIITMINSFHGRTYGAITATGQLKYQKSFLPMVSGFEYVQYNDIESLSNVMDDTVCAVLLEVIQGEGGIVAADKDYLKQVQELCEKYDALLMIDEVQTGIGRCGSLFAFEAFDIRPNVITLAKGLGSGVPIGAMLCDEKTDVFVPGDHASTFGGNPLATTAAKVVLNELINTDLLEHVKEVGSYLKSKLLALKEKYELITDVRGMGLMQGIEVSIAPKHLISKCIENGLMVVGAGENVVRFVPPLIITKDQIDECCSILEKSIQEINN